MTVSPVQISNIFANSSITFTYYDCGVQSAYVNLFADSVPMPVLMPQMPVMSVPQMPIFGTNFMTGFATGTNLNSNPTNQGGAAVSSEPVDVGTISATGKMVKGKGKGSGYGPEFLARVKQIAQNVGCNYRDLLAVMNSESGLNAQATNPKGGATGLIQFMPSTAKGYGTTTAALRSMTPIQQLDYVERILKKTKKSAGFSDSHQLTGGELYALVFLPARAKREVLTTSNELYYRANKGADANRDGKITKSELDARVRSRYVNDNSFLA